MSLRLMPAIACLLVPLCTSATTLKDVKIGLHVIDFVTNAPPGRTGIAIVYDPRIKESLEDAQAIFEALSAPSQHLPAALKPQLIDVREIDEASRMRAVFVADHMKVHYEALAEFGRRSRMLVLSADLDCVRAGRCTVGIGSNPRVEVIVNSQQAQASDIQFSEAFRMMVTEY